MSEKVVHEIRIVETDDGFRIELKGDKEELRALVDRLTQGGPFGGRGWTGGPFGRRGHRHGHGPFGHHHGEHEHGPFGHDVQPPPEALREAFHAQKRKLHDALEHRRRFGGRWMAQWGYDLGPWWDSDDVPTTPGVEPTGEPPADV